MRMPPPYFNPYVPRDYGYYADGEDEYGASDDDEGGKPPVTIRKSTGIKTRVRTTTAQAARRDLAAGSRMNNRPLGGRRSTVDTRLFAPMANELRAEDHAGNIAGSIPLPSYYPQYYGDDANYDFDSYRHPMPQHRYSNYRRSAPHDFGYASAGLHRSRSTGQGPAPVINIHNRGTQDKDNRAPPSQPPYIPQPYMQPPFVPYPVPYPPATRASPRRPTRPYGPYEPDVGAPYPMTRHSPRASPRASPELLGRRLGDRLGDMLDVDPAEMALEHRYGRSRSQGRSDDGALVPELVEWSLKHREAELKEQHSEWRRKENSPKSRGRSYAVEVPGTASGLSGWQLRQVEELLEQARDERRKAKEDRLMANVQSDATKSRKLTSIVDSAKSRDGTLTGSSSSQASNDPQLDETEKERLESPDRAEHGKHRSPMLGFPIPEHSLPRTTASSDSVTSWSEDDLDEMPRFNIKLVADDAHGTGSFPVMKPFAPSRGATYPADKMSIIRSTWPGNVLYDWTPRAELTTAPRSETPPLIAWYHLEREAMDFGEFTSVCETALDVSKNDLEHMQQLLKKVKEDDQKQRSSGFDMTPACYGDIIVENDGEDSEERQTGSLCFLSYPFFTMETPTRLSAETTSHPSKPLVEYLTNIRDTQREMRQAITSGGSVSADKCLHVTNVWCLILNQNLMVTCSKVSRDVLRREYLPSMQTVARGDEYILATIERNRGWQIPSEDAHAWPTIAALFTNEVSSFARSSPPAALYHNSHTLDSGKSWNAAITNRNTGKAQDVIIQKPASRCTRDTALQRMYQSYRAQFVSNANSDTVAGAQVASKSPPASETDSNGDNGKGSTAEEQVVGNCDLLPKSTLKVFYHNRLGDQAQLIKLADMLEGCLMDSASNTMAKWYRSCAHGSSSDIQGWLARQPKQLYGKVVESKVKIALLSLSVCGLFWPLGFEHNLLNRFWCAVKTFLDDEQVLLRPKHPEHSAAAVILLLEEVALSYVEPLAETFSGNEGMFQTLPDHFHRAWLHIASTFFVLSNKTTRLSWSPTRLIQEASSQLQLGERQLTIDLRNKELDCYEVCTSRDIAALILYGLGHGVVARNMLDVVQIYTNGYQRLEAQIKTEDLVSRNQKNSISAFDQELQAIESVLDGQLDVVKTLGDSIKELVANGSYLASLINIPNNTRQDVLLAESKRVAWYRKDQIQTLRRRLAELDARLTNIIDTNKDRQESAIVVFTVVTIIFLPLSFVASVFGMNTSDVRNMHQGQWIYWVIAIPLTLIVVGVSLYQAGVLKGVTAWPGRAKTRSSTGYQQIREERQLTPSKRLPPPHGLSQQPHAFAMPPSRELPPYPVRPRSVRFNITPRASR